MALCWRNYPVCEEGKIQEIDKQSAVKEGKEDIVEGNNLL